MPITFYEIRSCQNCGLRYPLPKEHPFGSRCPVCLGETQVVLSRPIAAITEDALGETSAKGPEKNGSLLVLLDNIRSAWNVGAIFRTADGLGIEKLVLCGITPTPEIEAVRKTSLGAERTICWEYARNALEAAGRLKTGGHILIALEQDQSAMPLLDWQAPEQESLSSVLIVGNEITGVDPDLLAMCDHAVYIPMKGRKHSLNVEVAFGIAAFQMLSKIGQA